MAVVDGDGAKQQDFLVPMHPGGGVPIVEQGHQHRILPVGHPEAVEGHALAHPVFGGGGGHIAPHAAGFAGAGVGGVDTPGPVLVGPGIVPQQVAHGGNMQLFIGGRPLVSHLLQGADGVLVSHGVPSSLCLYYRIRKALRQGENRKRVFPMSKTLFRLYHASVTVAMRGSKQQQGRRQTMRTPLARWGPTLRKVASTEVSPCSPSGPMSASFTRRVMACSISL